VKRVGIYIRVSTQEQAERGWSVEGQYEEIRKYCDRQEGWKVVRVFRDGGYSAKDLNRPALQLMLQQAAQGKIDALVCWKYDRLSRDNVDFPVLLHFLDKYGVEVVSIGEPTPDFKSPYGEFVIGIMGLVATLERRTIQVRTKMGLAARARKGLWCGGPVPYGYCYDKETGKLSINEEQIAVVREIFEKYLEWENIHKVRAYLNSQGWTDAKGKRWEVRAVRRVLLNVIYTGIMKRGDLKVPLEDIKVIEPELLEKTQLMVEDELKMANLKNFHSVTYPRPRRCDIDFDFKKDIPPCPQCQGRITVQRAGVKRNKGKEKEEFYCTHCSRTFTRDTHPIPLCPVCESNHAMLCTGINSRYLNYNCKQCLVKMKIDHEDKIIDIAPIGEDEAKGIMSDVVGMDAAYPDKKPKRRIPIGTPDEKSHMEPCPECGQKVTVKKRGPRRYKGGIVRDEYYCHQCSRYYDDSTKAIPRCPNCHQKDTVQYKRWGKYEDGTKYRIYVCKECSIKFKVPSRSEIDEPIESYAVETVSADIT